eukprot:jgi/Orpsp1_1/1181621/evm.model.c7180000077961.1
MSLFRYFNRVESPPPDTSNDNKHSLEDDISDYNNSKKTKIENSPTTKELIPPHMLTEKKYMAEDWYRTFRKEMLKGYFIKLKKTLEKEKKAGAIIFPKEQDMYTFTKCPLKKVRVVILGQDPYLYEGQAHGLCFSVKKGVSQPPSLINIFKELKNDLGDDFTIPKHGCLEGWTKQGVLLLNSTLTVRKGEPASHEHIGWQQFTDTIISHINQCRHNVVFLLWGAHAQKKGKNINKERHLVLKAVHPSPLSAGRGGFFGCKHFSKTNEYLIKNGYKPIDWNYLP